MLGKGVFALFQFPVGSLQNLPEPEVELRAQSAVEASVMSKIESAYDDSDGKHCQNDRVRLDVGPARYVRTALGVSIFRSDSRAELAGPDVLLYQ